MFYPLNILQLYLNKAGKNHSPPPSHVYESVQNYYEIQQFSGLSALKVDSVRHISPYTVQNKN